MWKWAFLLRMLSFPVVPARLYRLWPSWWCLWFVYTFKIDKYHAKKQFPPCFLPAKNITISQMNEFLFGGTHFPLNFVLFLWWKIVAFEGSTWRPTVHPGNFIWLSPENAVRWKREVEKGPFLSMATFFWRMDVYISDNFYAFLAGLWL